VRSALDKLAQDGVLDDQAVMFLTIAMGAPLERAQELIYEAMTDAGRREGRQRALVQLAHGRARQQPLLLVAEDVHWATPDTLDTLTVIANATADAPIVLLISSRLEGNPLDGERVHSLNRARLRRIALEPLSADESVELARQAYGPSDEAIDECVRRAEGNPLFLEQLLRHASERSRESVPGSIQSIVQARIDRLSATDRRALQGAAVVGQRFSLPVAMTVADLDVYDERPLVDAGLIRPIRDGFLFAHALIRDAVLQTVLRDDLRAMHQRAAEYFRTRDTVLHAEHLAAARDDRAAGAFLAASRELQRTHRKDAALELAHRGLEFDAEPATRAALLRLAGDMQRELGETEKALEAFERARDTAEGTQDRCRAQIGQIATLRIMDRIDDAYAILDEAEAAARQSDLASELSEIHYLRGSLHFPKGNIEGCLAEHRKSLDYAERADLVERRALALSGLGDAHYAAGRMFTAHESISQCLELARAHGLGAVEAANRFMLATVKIYMNETEQALADALGSADLAHQVGHARAEIVSRLTAGWVLASMAETDAARREANQGLEVARQLGAKRFEPFLQETLARVQLMEGARAQASQTAETALATLRDLGTMSFIGPWLLSTVALCTTDAARRHDVLAEGERLLEEGSIGHNHFRFHRYAGQACLDAGETAEARRQADLLERFTADEPTPWSTFHIARIRALADAADGYDAATDLQRLREEAEAAALHASIPALDAALGREHKPHRGDDAKAVQGGQ
jgi:tetratricopeptide (TPR) repeat protein